MHCTNLKIGGGMDNFQLIMECWRGIEKLGNSIRKYYKVLLNFVVVVGCCSGWDFE